MGRRHSRPVVLVFGGSAGAHRLNEATVDALDVLGPAARILDVTHQTGSADEAAVRERYAALGLPVRVAPFITDMGAAYAAADVVVGRAGAMTCAEVTAVGLPSILVPYPYAADDHQRRNAEALEQAGAAVVLEETKLEEVWLIDTLLTLLEDPGKLMRMSQAARTMAHPDAAKDITELAGRVAEIQIHSAD